MKLIKAINLTKRFGDVIALDNISFSVPSGLSMLIGPNGGGKSTFLRIGAGLLKPDDGELTILGAEPYNEFKKISGKVTYAFERANLPKNLGIIDFLDGIGEMRGADNVDEIIELFGLGEQSEKKFGELSQGYKRRTIMAQAFIGHPGLIFLDEPFSNLDPMARMELSMIIERMKKEGKNIFLITHILGSIEPDYIVMLYQGKVIRADPAEKLDLGKGRIKIQMGDEVKVVEDLGDIERMVAEGGRILEIKTRSLEDLIYGTLKKNL